MHSPEVRAELERCRALLGRITVPPELDDLAFDLINHLIELHRVGRLTPAFLQLSMKAFEGIEALAPVVEPLAKLAADKAHAAGHREDTERSGLPWVLSRYDPLDA